MQNYPLKHSRKHKEAASARLGLQPSRSIGIQACLRHVKIAKTRKFHSGRSEPHRVLITYPSTVAMLILFYFACRSSLLYPPGRVKVPASQKRYPLHFSPLPRLQKAVGVPNPNNWIMWFSDNRLVILTSVLYFSIPCHVMRFWYNEMRRNAK